MRAEVDCNAGLDGSSVASALDGDGGGVLRRGLLVGLRRSGGIRLAVLSVLLLVLRRIGGLRLRLSVAVRGVGLTHVGKVGRSQDELKGGELGTRGEQ
jgi:hypothetical protein